MLSKPVSIIEELHKISYREMICLVELPDYGKRYTNDISEVVWNGYTWTRLGFKIEPVTEDSSNRSSELLVYISNLGGYAEDDILANDNYSRARVNVYFVNGNCLDETEPVYSFSLQIQKINSVNRKMIAIKLGLDNPLMIACPSWLFHDSICQYSRNGTFFKGELCGYVGPNTCNYTWANCLSNNNTERFGGQLGLLGAIQNDD